MKNNFKAFTAGILTAALIIGAFVTVYGAAKSYVKTAQLHYNDIKICVDGEYIQPTDASGNATEPFIIDGTTYLPVRAVAGALNKEVDWDGDTKTVFIGAKPSSGNEGSMTNPVRMNTAKTVPALNDDYSASVTVKEVFRGQQAINIISTDDWERDYYAELCETHGTEYFVIKLSVTPSASYIYGTNPINYWSIKFSDGYSLLDSSEFYGETPDNLFEKLDFDTYNGGTVEGYIAFEVEKTDKMPVLGFETSYQGLEGCWFKLEE